MPSSEEKKPAQAAPSSQSPENFTLLQTSKQAEAITLLKLMQSPATLEERINGTKRILSTYPEKEDNRLLKILSCVNDKGQSLWDILTQDSTSLSALLNVMGNDFFYRCYYDHRSRTERLIGNTITNLLANKRFDSLAVLLNFSGSQRNPGLYKHFFSLSPLPQDISGEDLIRLANLPQAPDFISFDNVLTYKDLSFDTLSQIIVALLRPDVPNKGLTLLSMAEEKLKTYEHADPFYAQIFQKQREIRQAQKRGAERMADPLFLANSNQLQTIPRYNNTMIRHFLKSLSQRELQAYIRLIIETGDEDGMQRIIRSKLYPDAWLQDDAWRRTFLTPGFLDNRSDDRRIWLDCLVEHMMHTRSGKPSRPSLDVKTTRLLYDSCKTASREWETDFLYATKDTAALQVLDLPFSDVEQLIYADRDQTLWNLPVRLPKADQVTGVRDFADSLLRYRHKRNQNREEQYRFWMIASGYSKTDKFRALSKVLTHLYGNDDEKKAVGVISEQDIKILKQGRLGYVIREHRHVFENVCRASQTYAGQKPDPVFNS